MSYTWQIEETSLDSEEDIVLGSPWDFQSDKRGDISWRYGCSQANGFAKEAI